MSVLPRDDKERKNLPLFKMICGYFPKALREVTRVCVANNVRYNPDRTPNDINWARGKSTDQLGSLFRHILEARVDGLVFEDLPPEVQAACGPGFERVYVLAEAAWRALAALELQIEEQEAQVDLRKPDYLGRTIQSTTAPLSGTLQRLLPAGIPAGAGNVAQGVNEAIDSAVEAGRYPFRECCPTLPESGMHSPACVRNQL